jgi:predicted nucleic acid-binding protein
VRLFLDANVLFSAAHNAEGRSATLIDLAESGHCTLISSPHAIEECRRNLELKYPGVLQQLKRLLRVFAVCPECSEANAEWARGQRLPDKDAPILGAAVQAAAALLVTGDRTHFGHLYGKTLRDVLIATPAEALAAVLSELL